MPKRTVTAFVLSAALLLGAGPDARAGDSASFVDLGFSADGSAYMFAQYGVDSLTLVPWAELYAVDVPANSFKSGGVKKASGAGPADAGQDGSGLFHRLLAENASLAKKHAVDHTRQGTPLFVSVENGGGPVVEFRDFEAGDAYKATLVPYSEGAGETLKSSFFLSVERTLKSGKTKKYVVGTPSAKRPGVSSYAVRRVIAAPKDGALVFVIEMKKHGPKGPDIRYMVEALRL